MRVCCVVAQLAVGPFAIDCGNIFTGYYYDLTFVVFAKLITIPFNYIADKTLHVSAISFYSILCYAFLIQ